MAVNSVAERHEANAKRLSQQAIRAARRDWAKFEELDRAAQREIDLATIARANQFLAESRTLA